MSDKEFFELLKNEGMEGVLKQYTPVPVLVDKLDKALIEKDKFIVELREEIEGLLARLDANCLEGDEYARAIERKDQIIGAMAEWIVKGSCGWCPVKTVCEETGGVPCPTTDEIIEKFEKEAE